MHIKSATKVKYFNKGLFKLGLKRPVFLLSTFSFIEIKKVVKEHFFVEKEHIIYAC